MVSSGSEVLGASMVCLVACSKFSTAAAWSSLSELWCVAGKHLCVVEDCAVAAASVGGTESLHGAAVRAGAGVCCIAACVAVAYARHRTAQVVPAKHSDNKLGEMRCERRCVWYWGVPRGVSELNAV
eukprot:5510918-Amphidinium_carterae.3